MHEQASSNISIGVSSRLEAPVSGLRNYQINALQAIQASFKEGIHRQLVAMPTGSGKTVVFANLPPLLRQMGLPGRLLILAHREELIDQAAEKIAHWNPGANVGIEMAERHADPNVDILIASVPTIGRDNSKRFSRFDWSQFSACVCDEAHHSTAETYMRIFDQAGFLRDSKKLLLGVTATPFRGDGVSLENVYQKVVFSYTIRHAIAEGWLVGLRGLTTYTGIDISGVSTQAGDFANEELADAINSPARNQKVVRAWMDHALDRITIAFCANVQHTLDLASCFRHYDVPAESIWFDDPEREEKIARFRRGEIPVLTNCGILTEGFDSWRIECILLARPTKSSLLYNQMIGRGTRMQEGVSNLFAPDAEGTKQDCLLLDFVDNCGKHKIVTSAKLWGMPATMNVEGELLETAARKLEAHPETDFSNLKSIRDINVFLKDVDLFEETNLPEELESFATLRWISAGPDTFSLVCFQDIFVVRRDALGYCTAYRNGKRVSDAELLVPSIKHVESIARAIAGGKIHLLETRKQAWHTLPVSDKQAEILKKNFPDKDLAKVTRGQASTVITKLMAQNHK